MRGKLAYGILKRMGLNELISLSIDAFIDNISRLLIDKEYSDLVRDKIDSSKQILFEDRSPVLALNDFLLDVAKR